MVAMASPIQDKNGTYKIRKGVPKHLQDIVGKKEQKCSLLTKNANDEVGTTLRSIR